MVLLCFGGMFLIQRQLDARREAEQLRTGRDELMYFPSGRLLNQIAGSYRLVVADYAWLRAIQYFAWHAARDQQYEWLEHIIRTIAQLDPWFVEAYRFGSLIIAWDSDQPLRAIALLRAGMKENPLRWELPFQVAFIAQVRLKEYDLAAHYFAHAAKLPEVWSIVRRWAAVASEKAGNVELARQIWTELWQTHPNQKLKEVARKHLIELLGQTLGELQCAVDSFGRKERRMPKNLAELVDCGYLTQIPVEPFGGEYQLSRSGRVVSSSIEVLRQMMRQLQRQIERYRSEHKRLPTDLEDLVRAGYLKEIPADPFGGILKIEDGRVRTMVELPR